MNSLNSNSGWVPHTLIVDRIDSGFYRKTDIDNLKKLSDSNLKLKTLTSLSTKITDGPHDGYTFVEEGVLFIRSQNIKDAGFYLLDKKYIDKEFHDKFQKSWLKEGDLLITRIGHYYGNAAVVSKNYIDCNINHAIALVRLKKETDPYFVCAYINSPTGYQLYRRLGKSFTSPRVNLADYQEYLVPIPSNNIQYYIGNKMRKAEELREEAKRLRDEAEVLFTKQLNLNEFIYEDSSSWKVDEQLLEPYLNVQYYNKKYLEFQRHLKKQGIKMVPLNSILKCIIKNSSPDESDRSKNGIPSLIVSDIDPYKIEIRNSKIKVKKEYYEGLKEDEILDCDVVITTAGPPLGEACLVVKDMLPLLSGAHVSTLRPNEKITAGYLTVVLNSIVGQLEVEKNSFGIRQQYIFNDQLTKFRIPLIDMKLQQEIHEKIYGSIKAEIASNQLINAAKEDVESLINGNFDDSFINETE
ncbi:restriction endonuclease subunit S domain-containing protein [Bacillus halotolerans]|uniref:hypothetical protein n=1 Tax=Bacillus halotolerans TaxID=260554 RepID=UPI002DB5BDEF|nr:hypothetical protein [Bacillus halotolerans]MEC1663618.1 hypothetical protein [Bacillus halotolerans]